MKIADFARKQFGTILTLRYFDIACWPKQPIDLNLPEYLPE
ncbi:MAG: hypothetical protein AAGF01_01280 [Cyanobacteria bacterium P01_G01_bin.38]